MKPVGGGCKGRRTNNLGTTKQPNASGTHQLLFSLEEFLIAFSTVDGVTVNEDLIKEITHRFTANPTLKTVLMAADAKMFKGNLWTITDLTAAVSTGAFSWSLGRWGAFMWGFLLRVQ